MQKKSTEQTRREFLTNTLAAGLGLVAANSLISCAPKATQKAGAGMQFGLVTYMWGADWDLPTLIANCEKAKYAGVELRTQHAHGVEPILTTAQRLEVKKRFADSPVVCVGYGSNQEYHSPDPEKLQANIEGTYDLIKLCHDIGASGVKVKPNGLPDEVPPEKTIAQIAASLNDVGKYAADYGQKIRVEVHGRNTSKIPVMKAIFDQVDQPSVGVCWNCNAEDLEAPGLAENFNLLKNRFGETVHIREMNTNEYPYPELFEMLVKMNYQGWILLEARTKPEDRILALQEQLGLFQQLIAQAQSK